MAPKGADMGTTCIFSSLLHPHLNLDLSWYATACVAGRFLATNVLGQKHRANKGPRGNYVVS